MSGSAETKAIVGIGAAACAVCCAGPILGFLAASGLGTALGAFLWGAGAMIVGAAVVALVIARRRRQRCAPVGEPVGVALRARAGDHASH